jgi:hypothetical protein
MPAKPHVIIIAGRGEVFRNFLYSRTLDEIRSSAKVTLLSVVHDEEYLSPIRDKCSRIVPISQAHENRAARVVREILSLAHERHVWSVALQFKWRRKYHTRSTPRERFFWLMKTTIANSFSTRRGLRFLENVEARISAKLSRSSLYDKLMHELKPDLVFDGSHIHSPSSILPMHAAVRAEIPTVTFIFSWDNLFSRGRILFPYDNYLVWNSIMKEQLIKTYERIDDNQVTVTGTPQFDYHFIENNLLSRGEFCESIGADPKKKLILYSTGMPNYMPGEPEIVRGIYRTIKEMENGNKYQIMLRIYPKDQTGRFTAIKSECRNLLIPEIVWDRKTMTPHPNDLSLLTNMLHHCSFGINVASTISLELMMMNKPVINVAYDPPGVDIWPVCYKNYYITDHYKGVVESGAVDVAREPEELADKIRRAIEDPGALADERESFLEGFFGDTLDGRSGERVGRTIASLAAEKSVED